MRPPRDRCPYCGAQPRDDGSQRRLCGYGDGYPCVSVTRAATLALRRAGYDPIVGSSQVWRGRSRGLRAVAASILLLVATALAAQELAPPRKHLPILEPCAWANPGTGPWLAVWEIEEYAAVRMDLEVTCGQQPCQVLKFFKAAGLESEQPYINGAPPGGTMSFRGMYPRMIRGGVQLGRLPVRVEIHGADSWRATRVTMLATHPWRSIAPWPADECRSPVWD